MFGILARIAAVAGIAIALSGCYVNRALEWSEVIVAPAAPTPVVVRPAY